MSDQPQPPQYPQSPNQYEPNQYDPNYYAANYSPYGSAPTLVKVAGVLNLVMCGIDALYGLFLLVFGLLMATGIIPKEVFKDPANPDPPVVIIGGVVSAVALLPLVAGIVKLIGGLKLVRLRPGAWGWGLASGIIGCTQLWCSYFCVLPMAIGIFTIIVMCLDTVRRYLKDHTAARLEKEPT